MTDFSTFLKDLRTDRDLSQREPADILKISNTEVSRMESGERKKPSPITLKKISETFHIPLEKLNELAGYSPNDLSREEARNAEKIFFDIMEPYLERLGFIIKKEYSFPESATRYRWDLIAKNTNMTWAIEYTHVANKANNFSGYIGRFFEKVGRSSFQSEITKFSQVVSDRELYSQLIHLNTNKLNQDLSIILIDLDNHSIQQEMNIINNFL